MLRVRQADVRQTSPFSAYVHPAVVNSLAVLWSQSSATISSVLLENTGGFSLRKRAKWSTGGGGGGGLLLLFP